MPNCLTVELSVGSQRMGDRERIDKLLDYIQILHSRIAELEGNDSERDDS